MKKLHCIRIGTNSGDHRAQDVAGGRNKVRIIKVREKAARCGMELMDLVNMRIHLHVGN